MSKKEMIMAGVLKAETRELYRFLGRIQDLDDETLLPAPEVERFSEDVMVFFRGGQNNYCVFSAPICGLDVFGEPEHIEPGQKGDLLK